MYIFIQDVCYLLFESLHIYKDKASFYMSQIKHLMNTICYYNAEKQDFKIPMLFLQLILKNTIFAHQETQSVRPPVTEAGK